MLLIFFFFTKTSFDFVRDRTCILAAICVGSFSFISICGEVEIHERFFVVDLNRWQVFYVSYLFIGHMYVNVKLNRHYHFRQ